MRRRRAFTLIEIVVTMSLVVLVGSLLAVAGARMFQQKQFELSVKKISEELALTETLALAYEADITVTLKKRDGKLILLREVEDPPGKIAFLFKEAISFSGIALEGEEKTIQFYGNHHKRAPQELVFREPRSSKTSSIELRFFHVK